MESNFLRSHILAAKFAFREGKVYTSCHVPSFLVNLLLISYVDYLCRVYVKCWVKLSQWEYIISSDSKEGKRLAALAILVWTTENTVTSSVVIFWTEYIEMKENALAKTAKQFKDGMKCGTRYLIHNYYFTHLPSLTYEKAQFINIFLYSLIFLHINLLLYVLFPSSTS